MKWKEIWKKGNLYVLAFMAPWGIILVHSIINNIFPFGTGSLLTGDAGEQIYPLFVELWEKIHSREALFYSWNASNGMDFFLNFVYYLISPFNVFILLAPKNQIASVLSFIMVLKWACSAVTMLYFLMHTRLNRLESQKKLVSFFLTMAFLFSNCMCINLTYINWMDVIILFPLLLLSLERMVENATWKLYTGLLCASMLCNFYMTYQVCFFLLLWFGILMDKNTLEKRKKIVCFVSSSFLAAICSMIVILPAVLNVSTRYMENIAEKNHDYIERILSSFIELIPKLSIMDDISNIGSMQASLYMGIGCTVLICIYPFIKMNNKEKIKKLILAGFLFLSLIFGAMSFVWHGFSVPNGIYHRFLYILIFVCLILMLDVFNSIDSIRLWMVVITFVIESVIAVAAFFNISNYENYYVYLISALLFVFYQILLVLYCRKSVSKRQLEIVFCIVLLLELGVNSIYQNGMIHSEQAINNRCLNGASADLIKEIKLEKGERLNLQECSSDYGLVTSYPCSNGFLSYCDADTVRLYRQLGLGYSDNSSCSANGTSPLMNLMWNIRYGTSSSQVSFSDEKKVKEEDGVALYRMERLAGLGYMVDSRVKDWKVLEEGPFLAQNEFISLATSMQDNVFDVIYPKIDCRDYLEKKTPKDDYLQLGYYAYIYNNNLPEDFIFLSLDFEAEEDMDLYTIINSPNVFAVLVNVDGEQKYISSSRAIQRTLHIGDVKKGQKVQIIMKPEPSDLEENFVWFQFAKFNEENYAKAYDELSDSVYHIDEMTSTYIDGQIEAKKDGIMMTSVQDMDGFTVYVDGDECSYDVIGGALIGVPLKAGKHRVEFRYRTPYFRLGALISLAGVFIFIGASVAETKKKKRFLTEQKESCVQELTE